MSLLDFKETLTAEEALKETFNNKSDTDEEQFKFIMELIKEKIKSRKGATTIAINETISEVNQKHLSNLGYKVYMPENVFDNTCIVGW